MSEVAVQPGWAPLDDPVAWGERLAAAYRDIGARSMRELPIYHDALDVEAIGFQRIQDNIVGIIVTPWFLNVVTPADGLAVDPPGTVLQISFPAGTIPFTVSEIPPLGLIASCSLFSPMFEFADMDAARAAAHAALVELMMSSDERSPAAVEPKASAIDRRAFLRGTLTERRP
ncbi:MULTISPECIES: [NiFe]-hydrogenase assembly chaperone HybE [unclassified Bradyrhizobium]|uniref:[NiFe]-hydrogenase assembly chaperone HybE n=1 Tax=unclassified Bradyrhizobium TaxID=2631580 RepID=UPI002915F7FE|nr:MULTISPECIES: [NiFe]-hydrogenase assembly chaperone HybE [unclassified Bradyrhizobium]